MELRIVGDSFSTFDPDRETDAVLSRIHSSKVPLVLKHWLGLRKGSRLPTSADIDPGAIKAALPHVMITGVSHDPFGVHYRLVGAEIARAGRASTSPIATPTSTIGPTATARLSRRASRPSASPTGPSRMDRPIGPSS